MVVGWLLATVVVASLPAGAVAAAAECDPTSARPVAVNRQRSAHVFANHADTARVAADTPGSADVETLTVDDRGGDLTAVVALRDAPRLDDPTVTEEVYLLFTSPEFDQSLKVRTDSNGGAVAERVSRDGAVSDAGSADVSVRGATMTFVVPKSLGVNSDWSVAANAIVADRDGNGFHSQTETVPLSSLLPSGFPRNDLVLYAVHHRVVGGVDAPGDPAIGPDGTMPTRLRIETGSNGLIAVVTMSGKPTAIETVASAPVSSQAVFLEIASAEAPLEDRFLITWLADPGTGAVVSAPAANGSDRHVATVDAEVVDREVRIPLDALPEPISSTTMISVRGFVVNESHDGFESNGSLVPIGCLVSSAAAIDSSTAVAAPASSPSTKSTGTNVAVIVGAVVVGLVAVALVTLGRGGRLSSPPPVPAAPLPPPPVPVDPAPPMGPAPPAAAPAPAVEAREPSLEDLYLDWLLTERARVEDRISALEAHAAERALTADESGEFSRLHRRREVIRQIAALRSDPSGAEPNQLDALEAELDELSG